MEPIKQLKKICQPLLAEETWYVRNLQRRLSVYITKVLLYTHINANCVTLVMIIVGIIGGIFLGLGGYGNRLVGVICLQLFILFDCVDGEIARYRKQTSIKGAYLDLVANDISHISIFIGLTIGLLKYPDIFFRILGMHKEAIVILGIGCVIFPLLNRTAIAYLSEAGAKPADLSKVVLKDKKAKSLKSCLLFLHEPIHVINVIAVAALLDVSSLALIGYGIFFPLWWFVSVIVRFRKI